MLLLLVLLVQQFCIILGRQCGNEGVSKLFHKGAGGLQGFDLTNQAATVVTVGD